MLSPSPSVRIFIAREAIDLRKAYDGLASIVRDVIDEDPLSGHLFVFFNRRKDRVKILWWDRSGFFLLMKRFEHGRFRVDQLRGTNGAYEVRASDLSLLLEGIDLRDARRCRTHDDLFATSSRR